MRRRSALLLIALLWALIFLPGLGSTEIKGEEGRRILPAVSMLETGQWIVPYVGGKPFLRKPPLVNWAIASSFAITGQRNEWTARLPSVLSILLLAGTIIAVSGAGRWLETDTAVVAAAILLTQIGIVEKGRLAEIEAIYIALTGMAIICWLAWWYERRSPWLTWCVPGVLLGLAFLAKGPLHLVFFYAIVAAVLVQSRAWRDLLHPAPWAALLLPFAIFAAWFIPYKQQEEATRYVGEVWQGQFLGRIFGAFDWKGWATNIPRGLTNHLPWLLFAPLLWRRDLSTLDDRTRRLFQGTRLAMLACFVGILLIPGTLPRYVLSLAVPFALLLGFALATPRLSPPASALRAWWRGNTVLAALVLLAAIAGPIILAVRLPREVLLKGNADIEFIGVLFWPLIASSLAFLLCVATLAGRWKLARPWMIAASTAAVVGAGLLVYSGSIVPFRTLRDSVRPVAQSISESIPEGSTVVLYDPEYQPVIFYLQRPSVYAPDMKLIPADTKWLLTRGEKRDELLEEHPEYELAGKYQGSGDKLYLLRRP